MAWFQTKTPPAKQGAIVALESVSGDALQAQLHLLEQELHTAGFVVRRLEFPSSGAEEHIPGLFTVPDLLQRIQTLGIVAALDRAQVFATAAKAMSEGEVVLLTGSELMSNAWLASTIEDHGERVTLYRWLDELEHIVFGQRRVDLTVFLDVLPEHIDMQETVVAPAGWRSRTVPELSVLRDRYIEAAKLLPAVKIVSCFRESLLKPDSEIQNELWNLVRRIALKTNLPPRV